MRESYRNKKVLVLGLARSGIAAVRLLMEEGAIVTGADENREIAIPPDMEGIRMELGSFNPGLLEGCDEIVISPGIPENHPFLKRAAALGVQVSSELELGSRFAETDMIAVTGTNGKSTTVSMIGEILREGGYDVIVAGNVGLPMCSVVRDLGPGGIFVLEVSSFQLEAVSSFHPAVAGILNMTPDHLDRYDTIEDYYGAKRRIIKNCGGDDVFFYNSSDSRCAEIAGVFGGRKIPFSSDGPVENGVYLDGRMLVRTSEGNAEAFIGADELGVVGLHNIQNALAAVASLQAYDVPAEACRNALAKFSGLPHRMEEVSRINGVVYFNDSKATNVEATLMSLKGLDRKVILIAGGHDKGGDFSKLIPVLGGVGTIVAIGEAAPLIEGTLGTRVPVLRAATMREAVETAAGSARPGQLVILSPACASFDMFDNFEHRGEVFMQCVRDLGERDR